MSRTFSTNWGSADSLNVSTRCDCRPKVCQMREIVAFQRPTASAIVRVLHCVVAGGGDSSVRRVLCTGRSSGQRDGQEYVDRAARRECSPFDELFREVEATAMHTTPHLLDVVAFLSDVPAHGLLRGQVGTVVEVLDGAYEVEFSDDEGKTYAELALAPDELLVLHHRPERAA